MGITIHYDFKHKGDSKSAFVKLETVRKNILKLQKNHKYIVQVVSPIFMLKYDKENYVSPNVLKMPRQIQRTYNWAKIQYCPRERFIDNKYIETPQEEIKKHRGFVFLIYTDSGSEPTNIGLISKDNKHWFGSAFTKTQYATDFLRCHITIIRILDICKAVGILSKVLDEAQYWESRNLRLLAKNINESTAFISSVIGKIEETKEFDGEKIDTIEAPINKCKNFMRIGRF